MSPYSPADLRHGPLGAVGPGTPVLLVLPDEPASASVAALVPDLAAREAPVIAIADPAGVGGEVLATCDGRAADGRRPGSGRLAHPAAGGAARSAGGRGPGCRARGRRRPAGGTGQGDPDPLTGPTPSCEPLAVRRAALHDVAVHIPDGFLDAPTSVATGAVAVAGVGLCLRKARAELDERTAPLAGLVAAFIFAAQMFNFPVASGTSGHVLGGALATVAGRSLAGCAVRVRGAHGPGAAVRRRRADGARQQHLPDGVRDRGHRAAGAEHRAPGAARRPSRPWSRRRSSRALVSVPTAALAFVAAVRRRRHHRRAPRAPSPRRW